MRDPPGRSDTVLPQQPTPAVADGRWGQPEIADLPVRPLCCHLPVQLHIPGRHPIAVENPELTPGYGQFLGPLLRGEAEVSAELLDGARPAPEMHAFLVRKVGSIGQQWLDITRAGGGGEDLPGALRLR